MTTKVVCLLPVRNAEVDLPGFFESAAGFADAIVALDDGSTDMTGKLLREHPLVKVLISNPIRTGFAGWDDAANRNQLLAAAAELEPNWIISIDADERISIDDAEALRSFLSTDALPGVAYGFRCYSMVSDLGQAYDNPIWVYRLFAYARGQRFPDQTLHFAPVPTSIPRRALLRTTFRIQHLGGMTPSRRLARYEKYRQADPNCNFWPDYSSLLGEPDAERVRSWATRSTDTPVFYTSDLELGSVESDTDDANGADEQSASFFTIVVIDDGDRAGTLRAMRSTSGSEPELGVERLLVTARPELWNISDHWLVVQVDSRASRGKLKNSATMHARGKYLIFLDSSMELLPGAAHSICKAHRLGYASVTGRVTSGSSAGSGIGALLRRFGEAATDQSEGVLDRAPAWASIKRTLILDRGGYDESLRTGEDIPLALDLMVNGYISYSIGQEVLRYHNPAALSGASELLVAYDSGVAASRFELRQYIDRGEFLLSEVCRERFGRGHWRLLQRLVSPALDNDRDQEIAASLETFLLEAATQLGSAIETIRPKRGKLLTLIGRPSGIALVIVHRMDLTCDFAIVRFELHSGSLKTVVLPGELQVPAADGSWIALSNRIGRELDFALSRFDVQDVIGRPFGIEIDDIVTIRESDLPEEAKALLHDSTKGGSLIRALSKTSKVNVIALFNALRKQQGIETTLSDVALLLGLLRLRRSDVKQFHVLRMPQHEARLDTDRVEVVKSFLDAGSIVRPVTRKSRLRLVDWA